MPVTTLLACLTLTSAATGRAPTATLSNSEFLSAVAQWLPDIGPVELCFRSDGQTATFIPKAVGPAIFPYGSVTKMFTAVLVLRLAELGKLKLEDKLSHYGLAIPGDDSITLENLLTHTSGLPEYFFAVEPASESSLDKAIGMIRESAKRSKLRRGDFFYSNANYYLLGEVCSLAGGETLSDLYKKYVFDPLGLKCQPQRLSTFDLNWYGGAGALAGSLDDLATFGEAVASSDHRLLTAESWGRMVSPHVSMSTKANAPDEHYGYGAILSKLSIYPTASHGGAVPTNRGVDPFVSLLAARNNAKNPMGFAAFMRKTWDAKSLNALYGAFAATCATADLKKWILTFESDPDKAKTGYVDSGEMSPELASAITSESLAGLRKSLGTLKSFTVQAEEVRPDFVTVDGVAAGSSGTVAVSARFGPGGRLDGFVFK